MEIVEIEALLEVFMTNSGDDINIQRANELANELQANEEGLIWSINNFELFSKKTTTHFALGLIKNWIKTRWEELGEVLPGIKMVLFNAAPNMIDPQQPIFLFTLSKAISELILCEYPEDFLKMISCLPSPVIFSFFIELSEIIKERELTTELHQIHQDPNVMESISFVINQIEKPQEDNQFPDASPIKALEALTIIFPNAIDYSNSIIEELINTFQDSDCPEAALSVIRSIINDSFEQSELLDFINQTKLLEHISIFMVSDKATPKSLAVASSLVATIGAYLIPRSLSQSNFMKASQVLQANEEFDCTNVRPVFELALTLLASRDESISQPPHNFICAYVKKDPSVAEECFAAAFNRLAEDADSGKLGDDTFSDSLEKVIKSCLHSLTTKTLVEYTKQQYETYGGIAALFITLLASKFEYWDSEALIEAIVNFGEVLLLSPEEEKLEAPHANAIYAYVKYVIASSSSLSDEIQQEVMDQVLEHAAGCTDEDIISMFSDLLYKMLADQVFRTHITISAEGLMALVATGEEKLIEVAARRMKDIPNDAIYIALLDILLENGSLENMFVFMIMACYNPQFTEAAAKCISQVYDTAIETDTGMALLIKAASSALQLNAHNILIEIDPIGPESIAALCDATKTDSSIAPTAIQKTSEAVASIISEVSDWIIGEERRIAVNVLKSYFRAAKKCSKSPDAVELATAVAERCASNLEIVGAVYEIFDFLYECFDPKFIECALSIPLADTFDVSNGSWKLTVRYSYRFLRKAIVNDPNGFVKIVSERFGELGDELSYAIRMGNEKLTEAAFERIHYLI